MKKRSSSIVAFLIIADALCLVLFTALLSFSAYTRIKNGLMDYSQSELSKKQIVVQTMIDEAKLNAKNENDLGAEFLTFVMALINDKYNIDHIDGFCESYLKTVETEYCAVYAYDMSLVSDPKFGEFDSEFVKKVVAGQASSMLQKNPNTGTIDLILGSPISFKGDVVGGFFTSKIILNQAFADEIKATTGCDASIFNENTHTFTTMNGMAGRTTKNTVPLDAVRNGASHYITNGVSNGIKYIGYFFPIKDRNEQFVETIFIEQKVQMVEQTINNVISGILIVSTIALVIMIVIAIYLIFRKVRKPLKAVNHAVRTLAEGEADLTARLPEYGSDEISEVTSNVNQFIARVHDIVKEIKSTQNALDAICDNLNVTSQESASATSEIMANIQGVRRQSENQAEAVNNANDTLAKSSISVKQMQELIEEQSASINESSVAIEEMLSNISSVTNSVHKTATSFKQLDASVDQGKNKLSNVYEKINLISTQSKMLVQANQIISQIASETNLLAMNASIEAAHAGDAGKGFAVVANEIRKLAENSSKQSKEINNELKQITDSIQAVVSLSKDSQAAFEDIVSCLETTDIIIREIDNAMNEQENASKLVFNTLSNMKNQTTDVNDKIKIVSSEIVELANGMETVSQVSSVVLGSMDEMASGAQQISTAAQQVSNIANDTADSIKTIESKLGLFTV